MVKLVVSINGHKNQWGLGTLDTIDQMPALQFAAASDEADSDDEKVAPPALTTLQKPFWTNIGEDPEKQGLRDVLSVVCPGIQSAGKSARPIGQLPQPVRHARFNQGCQGVIRVQFDSIAFVIRF